MAFVEQVAAARRVVDPAAGAPPADAVVAVAGLHLGRPFREGGSDEAHVRALAAAPARWAPIVVCRADGTVIDGRHRVLAARRLGRTSIGVRWFDGDPSESFVEFLRANAVDGLPLTERERRHAARRVLQLHPDWADRRIGDLCGVTSKRVAQIRAHLVETSSGGDLGTVAVRVGRDGRARPVDPRAQRERIVEALRRMPGASLRAVAAAVGVSPETVRSVRASLRDDRPPEAPADVDALLEAVLSRGDRAARWRADDAVRSVDGGEETASFLERTDVSGADPVRYATRIPLSRVYEVADEARRRADFWAQLAERVEGRARRRGA